MTLEDFEGKPVAEVGIEIPGAAGGLRDAMKIDPEQFRQGDQVYVVLHCDVTKIRFEPVDKEDPTGPQRRVHVFGVEGATMVDGDLVRTQLDEQADRILKAKEAERGISRLPYDDDGEHGLAHARGEHAEGLVTGCPVCQHETDQLAAEEAGARPTPIGKRRTRKAQG